ncbi:Uncharacterised protein [Vibrio cholerae]|nr:Uncharacterised protein [Vibrio cholerae]
MPEVLAVVFKLARIGIPAAKLVARVRLNLAMEALASTLPIIGNFSPKRLVFKRIWKEFLRSAFKPKMAAAMAINAHKL